MFKYMELDYRKCSKCKNDRVVDDYTIDKNGKQHDDCDYCRDPKEVLNEVMGDLFSGIRWDLVSPEHKILYNIRRNNFL